jgi:hypothetical protein
MGCSASVAQEPTISPCFQCKHKIKAFYDKKTCETCGNFFHKGCIKVLAEVKPEVKNQVACYENKTILHLKQTYNGFEDHLHCESCYHKHHMDNYFSWYNAFEAITKAKKLKKDEKELLLSQRNKLRRCQTLPMSQIHSRPQTLSELHSIQVAPKADILIRRPEDDDYVN